MDQKSKFMDERPQEPAPTEAPKPDAAFDSLYVETPEQAAHRKVNEALIEYARDNFFKKIDRTAETGYSRELQADQARLNEYVKANGGQDQQTVILDPMKLGAAKALGFSEMEAIEIQLNEADVDTSKMKPWMTGLLAKGTIDQFPSRFGIQVYTNKGSVMPDVDNDKKVAVMMPSPDHAIEYPIEGLTLQENVEFVNRHEGWHVKDTFYDKRPFAGTTLPKTDSWDTEALKDPEVRKAFIAHHNNEVLSDVAALGDMIRAGKDTDIIRHVSAWRISSPDDIAHFSSLSLEGLKNEINAIGIDKFRKMTDQEAKEFYHSIVEKSEPTDKGLAVAAAYATETPENQLAILAAARRDPELQRALAFGMMAKLGSADDSPNVLTDSDKPVKEALDKWDASKILQDRAFALGGNKITPESMIKAYGAIESELHEKLAKDPANRLYDLQMSKLETALINDVTKIDYVEVNKARGVDITTDPAAKTPVPAKPEVLGSQVPSGPMAKRIQ